MTTEEFRAAVIADIQAWGAGSFPALPIVHENGPVADEDAIGPVWLDVELRWYGASIATVGKAPKQRHTGAVSAMCFYRQAEGTATPGAIVDSLIARLGLRRLGAGVLWAPQRTVPTNLLGWYKTGILVPFTLG